MAEILLSLTIIGVVAAITLPSLTGNINERTWNTQRKALYSRMSQAISLMPALNGFGTLDDTTDNAAETFITSGLSKVLKINNICGNNYQDCGIVTEFTNIANTKISTPTTLYSLNAYFSHVEFNEYSGSYSTPNTNAIAFETQNGESIIAYYNKNCRTEYLNQETITELGNFFGFPEATMCINFIYDLNGKKGPNTVNKDIGFITVFNATDSIVVAPLVSSKNNATYNNSETTLHWEEATKACTKEDQENRLPNINELSAILINKDLITLENPGVYWSSSIYNTDKAWSLRTHYGDRATNDKTNGAYARCVKR